MPVPNVGQNYAANREALIAALRNQPYQNPFGPPPPPQALPLPQAGPVAELPEGRSFAGPRLGQPRPGLRPVTPYSDLGAGLGQLPYGGPRQAPPGIIPPPAGLPPGAVARAGGASPLTGLPRPMIPGGGVAGGANLPLPGTVGSAALPATATPAASTLPANIDTDNYARPQYTVASRGPAPPGYNQEKWNDPSHQTPKYVVGRILQQFAPRTENVDAAVAEIAKAYPGAVRVGSGDVKIPGVGIMDILVGADVGGKRWHSGGSGGGGAKGAGGGKGGGVPGITAYDPSNLTSGSALADIIKQIQGIAGSGQNLATNRDALMAVLQGG